MNSELDAGRLLQKALQSDSAKYAFVPVRHAFVPVRHANTKFDAEVLQECGMTTITGDEFEIDKDLIGEHYIYPAYGQWERKGQLAANSISKLTLSLCNAISNVFWPTLCCSCSCGLLRTSKFVARIAVHAVPRFQGYISSWYSCHFRTAIHGSCFRTWSSTDAAPKRRAKRSSSTPPIRTSSRSWCATLIL